jgi:NADP-dependent 3-hydroxy acid dehydrogenase YdfG
VGRRSDALELVAKLVPAGSPNAVCHVIDLTDDDEVARLRRDLDHELSGLDILVHCAGVISIGAIDCSSVEQFDLQYRTNLRAPYMLTKALLPLLKRARGQVVFMNSTAGTTARATVIPYAATKHGLRALADGLRQEVNADGVRVLSVFLGRTASKMQNAIHELERRSYRPEHLVQAEDVASMVIAALALNRTAEVTDMTIRPMKKP